MTFYTFLSGFAIAATAFTALVMERKRIRQLQDAQQFLLRAKQETEEIAQLPLNNPHPLIQIAKDGTLLFANASALEQFRELRDEGLRHSIFRGLEFASADAGKFSREVVCGDITYHQTVTPALAGGKESYIVYCYDITERKKYEQQLKKANMEAQKARIAAEKATQARGDFLANMSHELRTPMNGIIGLSGILAESGIAEEHRELAEAVNGSARSLLILLNDILDFSKIEAGELSLESIPFDLRRITGQVLSLQEPVAERKGLALKSEIEESFPLRLVGDPSRLQQVLNNLIGNALKFTEKGSVTVEIAGKHDDKGIFTTRITVTDTGIGIPEEKQGKIFARFQQADDSTARKYGGTGLGLSITKNLIELMGGTISLKSVLGKGSAFTIILPLEIAAAEVDEAKESAMNGVPPSTFNAEARIMVVDDHPVNILYLRQALARLGFEKPDEASSGKQALDLFEKGVYDIILLDCQMPDMDGFETARKIRDLETVENDPVIIAVTADAMKGAEEKCMKAGMDDYISKPIDRDKLIAVLQRWLPGENDAARSELEREIVLEHDTYNNSCVFDWNRFHDFTCGKKEIEQQALHIFLENLETDIGNMKKSFEDRNHSDWDSAVHKIYGACAHMGANSMAGVCDEAQSLSGNDPEKIKELHWEILAEFEKLSSLLRGKNAA